MSSPEFARRCDQTAWLTLVIRRQMQLVVAAEHLRQHPTDLTDEECQHLLDHAAYSYYLDARDAGLDVGDLDPGRQGDLQC